MKQGSKNVQGKSISRSYNKYLRYRRDSDRTQKAFSTQLGQSKKVDKKAPLPISAKASSHKQFQQKSKHLARPKSISLRAAKRLAKHAKTIQAASKRHGVPVELICGVILAESAGREKAVSHCGARGLMQLMPATAKRFGVKNSFDPAQNIDGGTKYLRWLLDKFDGNMELAVAGYNAGEGAVMKYGNKIPPYRETQNYVPIVLGYTQSMMEIVSATQMRVATTTMPSYARRV